MSRGQDRTKNLRCHRLPTAPRVALKFHWSVTHQRSHSPLGPSASRNFIGLLIPLHVITTSNTREVWGQLKRRQILARPSAPRDAPPSL